MVVKKKKSRTQSKVKKSFAKTKPNNYGYLGAIERIVKPKEKEVRVKTFIVERPVYIASDKKFPARGYDEIYDSKESRYNKRKQIQDEEMYSRNKKRVEIEEDYPDEETSESLPNEYGEEEFNEQDDYASEEPIDELPEEDIRNTPTGHFRSRGLFMNVWWKKALLWAVVIWLGIFIFTFILQAINLVKIDLSRAWLFLLLVILVFSLVYQKYLSGKIKI